MKKDQQPGGGSPMGGRGFTIGMPKPTRIIKSLLIINLAAFLGQFLLASLKPEAYLGVTLDGWWQPWRYITFQFLHSKDSLFHIILNMLGLYMLGTPLAQHWGDKRFLRFYLTCGAVAGVAYVVMMGLMAPDYGSIPLIGASGGVYGIVLACAVLFPHFRLIFFLFPVPIRLAAVIIFGGMIFLVLRTLSSGQVTSAFWSDVAHLGGAVTAAVWIWILPKLTGSLQRSRTRANEGAWRRKMGKRHAVQREIDQILDKIREKGINSLSDKEKRKLQEATDKQQKDDRGLHNL